MPATITSTANPRVKQIRSLATSPRMRRRERLFVIEGVRLVEEALRSGEMPAVLLYDPEQLRSTERGSALLEQIQTLPSAFPATSAVIAAAADTVTPQGVVAAMPWPQLELQPPGLLLALDRVQDPGNAGTLLRTAEATGVGAVLCIVGTVDLFSPKVVRAGMGAHFRVPIRFELTWEEARPILETADHIYGATASATMPYYAADWRQPSALIIGNEAQGLSQEALEAATKLITIPMKGQVESLNAAIAGSVMLFEALRQRSRGRT